ESSITSFISHCTLSYPTAELLDALWSYNPYSFWTNLYRIRTFYKQHTFDKQGTFRGLAFVTWLKNNVSHVLVIYSSGNADLVYYLGVYQGRTRFVFLLYAWLGPVHSPFSNTTISLAARMDTYYP